MQVTETVNDGLLRELTITIPQQDMESQLVGRLEDLKGQVRLNGFRQGKVPVSHLRKIYGKQAMAEIVNEIINKRTGEVLVERGEKAAQQPSVTMTEDEGEAEQILAGKRDFEFKVSYEVLPEFEVPALDKLEVERPIAEVSDDEVDEQALAIAETARPYSEKSGKAAAKDRITIDYVGKIDGEAFDGGADTDAKLVLGSGTFIPGFEEQLTGKKAGDEFTLKVTFPADYTAAHLAGKDAEFDVVVKQVEKPGELTLDDELAKQLGLESADRLREVVRMQMESQRGTYTRAKVKRQILDQLDEQTKMDMPQKMVEQEFDNIWHQLTHEMEHAGTSFADEDTTEEDAREEYRKLAERRVRLGLVLGSVGESQNVQITEEELQRAIQDHVRQYPGREQQVIEHFQNHPDAVAGLRAPLYEDKVVDYIMSVAKVTDKNVSVDELTAIEDE